MDRKLRPVVTLAVMGGIFVAALDTTIVAAAMPTIAQELGHRALFSWPFAIYMVASTATVPLYGRLADSSGRKRLYQGAVGVFLLGSLLCGLAPTMPILIAARLVQGIGAGGILPLALTVAGDLYEPEKRARILGLFSSVWAFASVVGPLVGGGIVDGVGWRWIFLLNLPFGLLSAFLLQRYYREERHEGAPARPDFAGAVALTLALGAFLAGLYRAGDEAWLEAGLAGLVAVGFGALFVRQERGAESPIVDTGLLRIRIVAASNAVGFLSGALLFAIAAYVPRWVQDVGGGSATAGGFALTPMSLGWLTGAFLVGRLVPRLGYRVPVLLGVVLLAASSAFLVSLEPDSPLPRIYLPMAGSGLGLGFAFTATIVGVQNSVGRARLGQATSSVHLFRSVGGVFGVSLAGFVQVASLKAADVPVETAAGPELARSLTLAFGAALVFAVGAVIAALFVPGGRPAGEETPEPEVDEVRGWPEGRS
jgi:EmrB/QacA subfamily drug resistance transporter